MPFWTRNNLNRMPSADPRLNIVDRKFENAKKRLTISNSHFTLTFPDQTIREFLNQAINPYIPVNDQIHKTERKQLIQAGLFQVSEALQSYFKLNGSSPSKFGAKPRFVIFM